MSSTGSAPIRSQAGSHGGNRQSTRQAVRKNHQHLTEETIMSEESTDPLDKTCDELKQLRDEIRLKLQLGAMELRDEW